MKLENDRLIQALLRQPVDRRPIWLMRQAGRYLPEYRMLRQKSPCFMDFCKTPELTCEATLQPLSRFPLDAAIVFSDILTVPEAMGMDLDFVPGKGPIFSEPIRSFRDLEALRCIQVEEDLGYVIETVHNVTAELGGRLPLIGFAGSPWTLATYMVEGGSSRTFSIIRKMLNREPELLHQLLKTLTQVITDFLNKQITAGTQAIMIFDTWGGVLPYNHYLEFSLSYMSQIVKQLLREVDGKLVPVVFFTKQAAPWLEQLVESGCDAIGLDASIPISVAKSKTFDRVGLQGNLDPFLLFSKPEKIQQGVIDVLDGFGPGPGLVFNLGHGVDKDTPIDHVAFLVEAVHGYRYTEM